MKLITFVIPCYNSGAFMEKCVDSILPAGDEIEILIINDGSSDNTGMIADRYAERYPNIVRAIHQENGGHGEGVNQGMRHANGLFFKVVDSDDSLDEKSLEKLMSVLRGFERENIMPDMIVCDYVRNKQGTNQKKTVRYENALPKDRLLGWDEVKKFGRYQNLMMHAIIYKTSLLTGLNFTLPKHTYYVDCLFSYIPVYNVKTLYYLNVPLYQYLVGQPNQSVSKSSVIRNIDQMLRVCNDMIEYYLSNKTVLEVNQEKLLLDDMALIISIASSHLVMANTKEMTDKNQRFWESLERRDIRLYNRMRRHAFGFLVAGKETAARRKTVAFVFNLIDKFYKINK